MFAEIAWLVVQLSGGFWQFREAMLRRSRRSASRRLMQAIYYAYLHRYGAYIGHSARFASEPCFPHGLHGIFIAGNAQVGQDCTIFHQVTIGANSIPDSKGVGTPTVGNGVYVGAGAKIIGAVRVGNNCRIGANCVVARDVPDNTVAVMPQPDLIQRSHVQSNKYYRWSPAGPVYFERGRWVLERDPVVIERLHDAL